MDPKNKELKEVAVIIPFASFTGSRVASDKRCQDGRTPDKKDAEGKVLKKGKPIKTDHKVRIDLPVPLSDDDAQAFYKVPLGKLVEMGVRQRAYSLNKSDAYISEIGTREVDIKGLTALVEQDCPIVERARATSETKQKAQKFDALKAKFGVSDDEELEKIITHAMAKKKGKK